MSSQKTPPSNPFVTPLLTDLYQITMAYGYWCNNKHETPAVFEMHFRKNPFSGEYTIFAGLESVVQYLENFRFQPEEIEYLQKSGVLPAENKKFFSWLESLTAENIKVYAMPEGSMAFPREPIIQVAGPLAVVQLLETTILNLVNYASLITTNAARFKMAAGADKTLLEFGLRRAQGPDGGMSASKYAYLGGFDGTSNVMAGKTFGVPIKGTMAHSFVTAFSSLDQVEKTTISSPKGEIDDFIDRVLKIRSQLNFSNTHEGELAAFIAYGQAYPHNFLALVDTYDTLSSGVKNFLCVAVALAEIGFSPVGLRLDSGDLAYLSKEVRKMFLQAQETYPVLPELIIVASNDINEDTLMSLNHQGHEIDAYGIGTHLVTCQAQPALGGVYKLVELNNKPRIKLSQEPEKITIPGRKQVYRIWGKEDYPVVDLLCLDTCPKPEIDKPSLCRHPFRSAKRAHVIPSRVEAMLKCYWDGEAKESIPSLEERRKYVLQQLAHFRSDHLRQLNPTPYKVSVNEELFQFFHNFWQTEAPIGEIL